MQVLEIEHVITFNKFEIKKKILSHFVLVEISWFWN